MKIFVFYFIFITASIENVAQKIYSKILYISRSNSFKAVKLNIYDPCKIDELKKFVIYEPEHRPKCLSSASIDLNQNPETNTGYRYGAKEVWEHLLNLSDNSEYKQVMNGLQFSITTQICKYYLKTKYGYSENPQLFKKLYSIKKNDDLKYLLSFIYTMFLKINLRKFSIPVYILNEIYQIHKHISTIQTKTTINLDFSKIADTCFAILNCIGCEKCRLWGKVQFHGLLTAFNVQNGQQPKCLAEFVYFIQLMTKLTVSCVDVTNFLK
ncbi:Endoplasmic Reticulum Oxidoreductin [Pseudoloma neurophilia]|uniref:Endoplasmic Reticulum Oxidoreductin n=1 Tax=Pseudoloma neurophilia TaxID=146866 RepID=A0A0R0LSK3_9MICR|nr:Endoplasmic Reticulum Oxidoreductin [Pseudoloma neurophilia]